MNKALNVIWIGIVLFCFSCAKKQETITWKVEKGKASIVLPDAGSSWYVFDTPEHKFKARKIELIQGELTMQQPDYTKADSIFLPKVGKNQKMNWSANWTIDNELKFSISLTDTRIYVVIDSNLIFQLSELDELSMNYLMDTQESMRYNVLKALNKNAKFLELKTAFSKANPKNEYYNAQHVLSWLTDIYVNDGSSLNKTEPDSSGLYISGYYDKSTDEALVIWAVNKATSFTTCSMRINVLHYKVSSNTTLAETSFPLPSKTRLFVVQNWSGHDEYKIWWKEEFPNKPLPSILPKDAGIVVNQGLLFGVFGSDMLTGSMLEPRIIIRSEAVYLSKTPGQFVGAFLSFESQ